MLKIMKIRNKELETELEKTKEELKDTKEKYNKLLEKLNDLRLKDSLIKDLEVFVGEKNVEADEGVDYSNKKHQDLEKQLDELDIEAIKNEKKRFTEFQELIEDVKALIEVPAKGEEG